MCIHVYLPWLIKCLEMQIKVQPLIKQLFKCGVCIFVEQRSATPKSKVKCQLQRAPAFEISKDDPFLIS